MALKALGISNLEHLALKRFKMLRTYGWKNGRKFTASTSSLERKVYFELLILDLQQCYYERLSGHLTIFAVSV